MAPVHAQWNYTNGESGYYFMPDRDELQSDPYPRARRNRNDFQPRRSVERPAETPREALLPKRSSGRVLIVVSTDRQKLTVYDDGVPVATSTVSTGVADHPTPHGVFSIIEKQRFHASNIYSDAPMPFMQRLTWSGVALHQGHVTGRPASHGCIRLPAAFAAELFRYTREGARVIVAHEDVTPVPTGSFALFATQPSLSAAPVAAPTDTSALDVEISGRPRGASTAVSPGGKPAFGVAAPISLLVSRRTGKLYVRRAFRPLFQVPITIDDQTRPIGTHVFIAGADADRGWSAITLSAPLREASLIEDMPRSYRPSRNATSVAALPPDQWDGLARLHLAPGTAALLASLITPGATLIISDDGARGRETWDGTNFIALSE